MPLVMFPPLLRAAKGNDDDDDDDDDDLPPPPPALRACRRVMLGASSNMRNRACGCNRYTGVVMMMMI